jgi:flagellin
MTVINTNVRALFSQSALRSNERALSAAMEQLSTGKRINYAKDDAAGLAIGMRMTADLRGLAVAVRNAHDGVSLMQTADGSLGEVANMLQRMRELAVQSANGTLTKGNRQAIQKEVDQLLAEIDNVARTTNFNGIKLLDGSAKDVRIQSNVREDDQVSIRIAAVSSKSLGLQGFRIEGQLTSGRVGEISDLAHDDVLINGKPAFMSADYEPDTDTAYDLAEAINSNIGQHRVKAVAYNTVKGVAPLTSVFSQGALSIGVDDGNLTEIAAASSVEELVANINRDAYGVTAVLGSDGAIELSNDTGRTIVIGGTAVASTGLAPGTYSGYVTLDSLDGEGITVKPRNTANGFPGGAGTVADVRAMGLNESTDGKAFAGGSVTDSAIDLMDDLRINGVKVGPSVDGSALAKAAAINAISEQSGVTATARTEVLLAVNMDQRPKEAVAQVTAFNTGALDPSLLNADKFLVFTDGTNTYQVPQSAADVYGALADQINGLGDANVETNGYKASIDSSGRLVLTASEPGTPLSQELRLDYNAVKEKHLFDLGDPTRTDPPDGAQAMLDTAGDEIYIQNADGDKISVAISDGDGSTSTPADALAALADRVNADPKFNAQIVASVDGTKLLIEAKNAGSPIPAGFVVQAQKGGVPHVEIQRSANVTGAGKLPSEDVSNEQGITIGEDPTAGVENVPDGETQVRINGSAVDLRGADSIQTVVSVINAAGINGVTASTDINGQLVLTAATGADITVTDMGGGFVTAARARSGELADDLGAGDETRFKISGRISLVSDTDAAIRVESFMPGSAEKIGFADQGGSDTLVGGALTITTQEAAGRAITAIDMALETVGLERASLGAFQNRLLAAVDNLSTNSVNLGQSRSRIMDADYAQTTSELARTQIIQQASTAMLAQANASQQSVMQLIQQ